MGDDTGTGMASGIIIDGGLVPVDIIGFSLEPDETEEIQPDIYRLRTAFGGYSIALSKAVGYTDLFTGAMSDAIERCVSMVIERLDTGAARGPSRFERSRKLWQTKRSPRNLNDARRYLAKVKRHRVRLRRRLVIPEARIVVDGDSVRSENEIRFVVGGRE